MAGRIRLQSRADAQYFHHRIFWKYGQGRCRWLRQLSFSMGVCCSRQHQGRPSEICLWEEVELFHHECVAMRYRFIILFAMAWLTVAPGKAQPGEAVKPEHRVCQRDADCQLVEVPCT